MIARHEEFRISFEARIPPSADNEVTSARRERSFLIFPEGHFGIEKGCLGAVLTGERPDPGGLKGSGFFLFKARGLSVAEVRITVFYQVHRPAILAVIRGE
jgi:hypothetical protein